MKRKELAMQFEVQTQEVKDKVKQAISSFVKSDMQHEEKTDEKGQMWMNPSGSKYGKASKGALPAEWLKTLGFKVNKGKYYYDNQQMHKGKNGKEVDAAELEAAFQRYNAARTQEDNDNRRKASK